MPTAGVAVAGLSGSFGASRGETAWWAETAMPTTMTSVNQPKQLGAVRLQGKVPGVTRKVVLHGCPVTFSR